MTHFSNYKLDKTSTYVITEEDDEVYFCQRIEVTDVYIDVITGTQKILVKMTDTTGSVEVLLDREVLVGDILKPLVAIGLEVSAERVYAVTVSEILMLTEQSATKHYSHDALGFHRDYRGNLRYFSAESLDNGIPVSRHVEYERYRSKGTYEEWFEAVSPYVNNIPALQLALIMGLSAPVVTLLSYEHALSLTPIYTLIGPSSTSKSTALKFMCGLWNAPSSDNGGIELLIDTENYMMATLSKKYGYPSFFDDLSTVHNGKDLTQLVYTLASSKERGRCNSDGTPRPKRSWSGAVFFTGEQSMLAQSSVLKGRNARLIEFNQCWTNTKDPKIAESLTDVCSRYYGTAHIKFLGNLIEKHRPDIKRDFEEAVALLSEKFEVKDGIQRRQTQLFAVLVVTLKYAREVFDFDFDFEAIDRILEETYRANAESEPEADRLYNSLIGSILAQRDKYPTKEHRAAPTGAAYGEEGLFKHHHCFWVEAEKFNEYLFAAGYKDSKYAVKILCDAGYLAKFSSDRYRVKHRIGGVEVSCYALFINSNRPISAKKKQTRKKDQNRMKNLLADDEEDEL